MARSLRVDEVRQRNFDTLTTVLADAGVDHFVVATGSRFRTAVGVRSELRPAALTALRSAAVDPDWCVSSTPHGSIVPVALTDDDRWSRDVAGASVLETYHVVTDPGVRRVVGRAHRCELQFWEPLRPPGRADGASGGRGSRRRVDATSDDGDHAPTGEPPSDSLCPPSPNPFVETVPARRLDQDTITVAGRRHPVAPEFRWYLEGAECPFPIDLVYTWVDGDDPAWRERRDRAAGAARLTSVDGSSDERFRTFDELRYSLRSVWEYVPYVRRIFVVTDRQRPTWLAPHDPVVSVVDHRDVFDDPSALPTFNSHAIESQLHHIEGLAENYLYLNDDVFFGRLSDWSTYFDHSGRSKFFPSRATFRFGDAGIDDPSVDSAGKNLQRLLFDETGWTPSTKIKHTPHAQQRSLMCEIEDRFTDAYVTTRNSRFRSTTDVSLAVALHHRYGQVTGRATIGTIAYQYLNLAHHNLPDRLESLLVSSWDTLCLNDGANTGDRDAIRRQVQAFLEHRFPFVAPWETDV